MSVVIFYYEIELDGSGFVLVDGEPEFFSAYSELIDIVSSYSNGNFELCEVTQDNWQSLRDSGAFA
ncbi:hypothetical protein [Thaumasiovibrio subtropicus]|uniref:hypothetical protein n=1 Tax=Thaumasiovibrio subtropicus TaxID=1891207 RepID=UPI000B34D011|nr:hypothetical protein [Thaumasiovibrio subtropicus]